MTPLNYTAPPCVTAVYEKRHSDWGLIVQVDFDRPGFTCYPRSKKPGEPQVIDYEGPENGTIRIYDYLPERWDECFVSHSESSCKVFYDKLGKIEYITSNKQWNQ